MRHSPKLCEVKWGGQVCWWVFGSEGTALTSVGFSEKAQNSQKEHHIHIRGKNLPYISIYAYSCMSKCIEHSCGTSPPPPPITYNMYIQGMLHVFAYKYLQNYIWYVMSNTYTVTFCVYVFKETENWKLLKDF